MSIGEILQNICAERNVLLNQFNNFPSGLCKIIQWFVFFFLHLAHFSFGDRSQKSSILIVTDAVPWVLIGDEKSLDQQLW